MDSSDPLERWRAPVRLAYLALLLLVTLSRFDLDPDLWEVAERLERMLVPRFGRADVADAARNIVLFAGWGLLWMLTAPWAGAAAEIRRATASGAAFSALVECIQLLSDERVASLLDIATNTAGALAGAAAAALAFRMLRGARAGRSYLGLPASLLAASYGSVLAAEAFIPALRQVPRVTLRGGPLERLAFTLERFTWSTLAEPPLTDLLLFAPGGTLAVAALRVLGLAPRRAAGWASALGLLLFGGLELAHGMLGIEIHAGAALVHAGGYAVGAWLAAAALPEPGARPSAAAARTIVGAYALLLAVWALRPFVPESGLAPILAELRSPWWVPLRSLAARRDLFSAVDVVVSFGLYVPLGAVLAVWPLGRGGAARAFLPAVLLSATLELAQAAIEARTLDITDFLVQTAGAAVGWAALRRAGLRPAGYGLPGPPAPVRTARRAE